MTTQSPTPTTETRTPLADAIKAFKEVFWHGPVSPFTYPDQVVRAALLAALPKIEATREVVLAWEAERQRMLDKTGIDIGASCFEALNLWHIGHQALADALVKESTR